MRNADPAGWRIVMGSVMGPNHAVQGKINQDRYYATDLAGHARLLVVADGAGSRTRAEMGAQFAVAAATEAAQMVFGAKLPLTLKAWRHCMRQFTRETLNRFDHSVATQLHDGSPPRPARGDYATTLLAVVAAPPVFGIVNVGDCFMIASRRDSPPQLVLEPDDREHAGHTIFLTSANRADAVRGEILIDEAVTGIAICTDGLAEGLLGSARGGDGRSYPIVPAETDLYFRYFANPAVPAGELEHKLSSQDFAASSGDDKTMVMAVATAG